MIVMRGLSSDGPDFKPGDSRILPDDLTVPRQGQIGIRAGGYRLGARLDLRCHSLEGGGLHRLARGAVIAIRNEMKTLDAPHIFAFHMKGAIFLNRRHQLFLLGQPAHEHARAAVDKTLCEPFMQGI